MGSFRDDLKQSVKGIYDAGRSVILERADSVSDWVSGVGNERRLKDFDDRIEKAARTAIKNGRNGTHDPSQGNKSLGFDPFDMVSTLGWSERPSSMSYKTMENVSTTVPVIADVIRVRMTQVQTFCKLPETRFSPGFRVRLKDRNARVSRRSDKRARELEAILTTTGYVTDNRPGSYDTFRHFAGMFVRDSLTFDQACYEVIPDRKGRPSYISVVDPTTIRLVNRISVNSPTDPFAVQVLNGAIVTDFTPDELAFCVRHPRSGLRTHGYGLSEVETLVKEITGFLWGIEYNRRFFSQGSATKGILNFKGTIPDKHMQSFRRQWYAMVSGVNNAWRTPITNAEEIQWVNMQMSSRDMEMTAWMDFLIKIVCARFQISPEEVNFSYGNTNQAQAMGTSSTEEKLKASRDLGLRPLVQFLFESINDHFICRLDPDFEAVPVGLDSKGPEAEADLLNKQVRVFMTVNEARDAAGLKPLPDGKGDCLLDGVWLQNSQNIDSLNLAAQSMEGLDESPEVLLNTSEESADEDSKEDSKESSISDFNEEFDITVKSEPLSKSDRKVQVVRYEVDL